MKLKMMKQTNFGAGMPSPAQLGPPALAMMDRTPMTPSAVALPINQPGAPPQPQVPQGQMMVAQQQPPGSSISLALLIDFIVQRTYHDLTVLAEL